MTAAGYLLEPKPLAPPLQKACHRLLAAGALVFAFGLYLGFVRHANSVLVFLMLSVTTLLFGVVVLMLLKPGAFAFIGAGAAAVESSPEAQPEAAAVLQPDSRDESAVEPRTEAPAQAEAPAAKSGREMPVKADLAILMNTTLGDILLAALRSDPEGAGRIFARAVTQAEAPAPAAQVLQPGAADAAP